MAIPETPDSTRYRQSYSYAFYLEWPATGPGSERYKATITEIQSSASNDYVELLLNPQQINMREPTATTVTFTQGGGKLIESRGGLIIPVSISGTTGYVPGAPDANNGLVRKATSQLVDVSFDAEQSRAQRSGFAHFYKLRQLFRTFNDARKRGIPVRMYYVDYKGDEYWQVEPQEFQMNRNSRRPFLYDYSISFQAIAPTDAVPFNVRDEEDYSLPGLARKDVRVKLLTPTFVGSNARPDLGSTIKQWVRKANALTTFANYASGDVALQIQSVLNAIGEVVQIANDAASVLENASQIPYNAVKQVSNFIDGLFATIDRYRLLDDALIGMPQPVLDELNDWCLDMKNQANHMQAYILLSSSTAPEASSIVEDFYRPRALEGLATDLMETTTNGVNPLVGPLNLNDVTDADALLNSSFRSEIINAGESIFDVSTRLLGSVHRFIDLVVLNALAPPYIVDDSIVTRPPNTLAWGDYIKVPAVAEGGNPVMVSAGSVPPVYSSSVTASTITSQMVDGNATWLDNQWVGYTVTVTSGASIDETRVVTANDATTLTLNVPFVLADIPVAGDTYTLTYEEFVLWKPITSEEKTYGRDLLLAFNRVAGETTRPGSRADLSINARGDLATVQGLPNFTQAIMLVLTTERGRHPFHPEYGVGLPVGRPMSSSVFLLHTNYVKRSLLRDPRVAAVQNPRLTYTGDAFQLYAEIRPVNATTSRTFKLAV